MTVKNRAILPSSRVPTPSTPIKLTEPVRPNKIYTDKEILNAYGVDEKLEQQLDEAE